MSTNDTTAKNQETEVDLLKLLYYFFKAFKRFWWVVLIITLVFGAVGGLLAYVSYKPKYESTASYAVEIEDDLGEYYSNQSAQQLSKTFPYILGSGELIDIVKEDLGVTVLPGVISASVLENTNLLTISVTSKNPEDAYKILCSVVNNYPSIAEQVVGKTRLNLVISPSIPDEPYNSPHVLSTALKVAAVGFVLALALILVIAFFTSTILSSEDIKEKLKISHISTIPFIKTNESGEGHTLLVDDKNVNTVFYEAIGHLRENVLHRVRHENAKTLMITSTVPGEGKTTVSVNLAMSLAKHAYRILLIDCDLRNPSVLKYLNNGENTMDSISDYLLGETELDKAILHYSENLDIMAEVHFNSRASELVGSDKMFDLISEMKDAYDLIIVDTPPVGIVSESLSLASKIDGLVYVIRQDYVQSSKIADELDRYSDSGIKMINVVLNMAKSGTVGESSVNRGNGKYGKYYNYYSYKKYRNYNKKD